MQAPHSSAAFQRRQRHRRVDVVEADRPARPALLEMADRDPLGRADRAVMRVVEEEGEACAPLAHRAERRDQVMVVPLMHDHQMGAVHLGNDIVSERDAAAGKFRIGAAIGGERHLAMIGEQVGEAPGCGRRDRGDVMATRDQFVQHAPDHVLRFDIGPASVTRVVMGNRGCAAADAERDGRLIRRRPRPHSQEVAR